MTKEEIKAYQKVYYLANKETVKAQTKAWQKSNKEQKKAIDKAWKQANPEKLREYERKRQALKHQTEIEPINEKEIYLRDGWICQHCKKRVNKKFKWPHPVSATLDHIIPLSQGGTHTYRNVQLAHFSCNNRKYNNILVQGEQLRIF